MNRREPCPTTPGCSPAAASTSPRRPRRHYNTDNGSGPCTRPPVIRLQRVRCRPRPRRSDRAVRDEGEVRPLQRTWNTNGGPIASARTTAGRRSIGSSSTQTTPAWSRSSTPNCEPEPGQFTFLHIALPDETGHEDGFMSDRYLAGVRRPTTARRHRAGHHLRPARPEPDTVVLLTADHGGDGGSHSDQSEIAELPVPFMAWGPGVPAGRDLYSLNDHPPQPRHCSDHVRRPTAHPQRRHRQPRHGRPWPAGGFRNSELDADGELTLRPVTSTR